MFQPTSDVPLEFRCPITFEIMEDPVEMDDQCTYEREAIAKWLLEHSNESPMTHQKITGRMRPNTQLKQRIQSYLNNKSSRSNDTFNIIVKNIQDKSFVLQMKETDTVGELKNQIRDKTGIPIIEQRLIYMAKQLNDNDKTLKDYNITNNSTIHLLLRLRGGK